MNSSENGELPVGVSRQMQMLPPGATLQDATEWLRSCGVTPRPCRPANDSRFRTRQRDRRQSQPKLSPRSRSGGHHLHSRLPVSHPPGIAPGAAASLAGDRSQQRTLVAISPDPPKASFTVVEEDGLGFDLLTDEHGQLSHLFGLTYRPPEPVEVWFDLLGLGVPRDGMPSHLTLPAAYVVDSNGIAAYAFLEPDPTRRVDPRAVIESLSQTPTAVRPD
jgi:peroxiredoxin